MKESKEGIWIPVGFLMVGVYEDDEEHRVTYLGVAETNCRDEATATARERMSLVCPGDGNTAVGVFDTNPPTICDDVKEWLIEQGIDPCDAHNATVHIGQNIKDEFRDAQNYTQKALAFIAGYTAYIAFAGQERNN